MADFEAVIRRALESLSDPTQPNRVKVYDRARGAVGLQLRNMNPRPPQDMILRQMVKFEGAIMKVEAEFRLSYSVRALSTHLEIPRGISRSSLGERFIPLEVREDFLLNMEDQYRDIWLPRMGRASANRRWIWECLSIGTRYRLDPIVSAIKRVCRF